MTLQERMLQVLQSNTINSTAWLLANRVLHLRGVLAKTSITKFAELCHVSEPTISRFAKSVGYRNYIDLRDAAQLDFSTPPALIFHSPTTALNLVSSDPKQYVDWYSTEINHDLNEVIKQLDFSRMDHLVKSIQTAERVFIFGSSTSKMMADIIQYNLANSGKIVYVPWTSGEQEIEARQLKKTDIALVISTFGNYIHSFSPIISLISKSEAHTILFTQNPGIQETYLFDSTICVGDSNNQLTGTYVMLFATEYIVRRYWALDS